MIENLHFEHQSASSLRAFTQNAVKSRRQGYFDTQNTQKTAQLFMDKRGAILTCHEWGQERR